MPTPFVEDSFFYPLYNFRFFVKNHVLKGVWFNIWVFDLVLLVSLTVFMPVPSCFHYFCSVIEDDEKDGAASRSSIIVQDYFGYVQFFFHMMLIIVLSRSVINCVVILMGMALNV